MSAQLACDNPDCDRTYDHDLPTQGWFEVTRLEPIVTSAGVGGRLIEHFCSHRCLASVAASRTREGRRARQTTT